MATITATQSGNASAGATWTGGVKPGSSDTADLNGKTVTVDVDAEAWHIASLIDSGGGGILTVTAATTRNITIDDLALPATAFFQVPADAVLNITGAASTLISANDSHAGTLNFLGNITSATGGVQASAGKVNVTGAMTTSGAASYGIHSIGDTARIVVTGNLSHTGTNSAVRAAGGFCKVNGNVESSASSVINPVSSGITVVNGNVSYTGAEANVNAIHLATSAKALVIVNGNVSTSATSASYAVYVQASSSGACIISGNTSAPNATNTISVTANGGPVIVLGTITGGATIAAGVLITNGAIPTSNWTNVSGGIWMHIGPKPAALPAAPGPSIGLPAITKLAFGEKYFADTTAPTGAATWSVDLAADLNQSAVLGTHGELMRLSALA